MTTIADALKGVLDAQWAIPTGGTEPTWYVSDDTSVPPPNGIDYVLIQSYTLTTRIDAVNNTYSNKTHRIDMEVNTPTGDNRLKELADEVERILNTVAITGVNWQKVSHRENISDKRIPFYRERITCSLLEMLASSTGAYGSVSATTFTADHLIGTIDTTTATLTVSGAATVGTTLGVTGATTVGSVVTAGNVDGVDVSTLSTLAGATVTAAQLEDLLMFGSGNAAWVPCSLLGESTAAKIAISGAFLSNTDATDVNELFLLGLPTTRGALKLYVTGGRCIVYDADADDYVDAYQIYGMTETTATSLLNDSANRAAQGDYEYALADTDVSVYDYVVVQIVRTHTNANDLDIGPQLLLCYYAA